MEYRSRKYRPSKLIKRRRKVLTARALIVVGASILLIGSLSWFSFYDGLTINAIAVEGNLVIGEDKIEAIVQSTLEGKYLFLFSRSNAAIYPREQIKESLLNEFKRIESVAVMIVDTVSIKVIIEERSPYALWCRVVEKETEDGAVEMKEDCYFLDKDGFIFAIAPDFTGNIFFKYFDSTYNEGDIGRQFLTKEEFLEIDNLRLSFLPSRSVSLDIGKPIVLTIVDNKDLEIALDNGSKFLFSRNQDVSDMLANVESIFSSDIFKEKDSEIDYIDLRFGNKVYYKLKE